MTIHQEPQPRITVSSLSASPKKEGKFEKEIIPKFALFFQEKNYETKKHVSINLAWGKVVSEIDLIAIKNDEIIIIEVKSKKDKIFRAKNQLEKIRPLVDYCFIASDTLVEPEQIALDTGILYLNDENIRLIRDAKRIYEPISKDFLLTLKKESLINIYKDFPKRHNMTKNELASIVIENTDPLELKERVKEVVFSKSF